MIFGALRSLMLVFFNFDKLKSTIEFNKSFRSSLSVVDGDDTCGISVLIFDDKDLFGLDVCNGLTAIEC